VADVRVTGLASLSNRTFLELIDSLTRSYALALVVISPLMILLIGSLRGGLVSLVPNLTPIVITPGMMGFLGIPLDLFTLLIGSVVLGLAVDDTIHFIHNYLRYLRASADPTFAVHRTLVTAGAALLFTSAALAAGFLVFVFAYLDNLARFGALVAFAIVVAFVADVVVTPALIVTMTRASAGSIARRAAAVALLVPLAVPGPVSAAGAPPTGRQIMEWVENRNDGDDATMDIDMVLIDRSGKRRERRLRSFVRDVADGTRQVLFFRSPASVRNTAFLTHDYDDPERDDDQWLYLPALHRTKRIASAERSGSFMGSDLTYADMSSRPLDRYDYRLVKEIDVRGHPVWVVEATPRTPEEIERTGYTRQLLLVRKDNHVVVRAVSWLQKADRLKYMDVRGLEQIDGIWVPTEVQVTTKTGDQVLHETILTSRNIVLNGGVDPEVFTLRRLEQGL
jgi:hypothetical protein